MSNSESGFVWYELMTSDTAAALSFYRSVVGWEARDSGMPGTAYTILSAGPTMVGGLMALPGEARAMGIPPCWTGYIGVADVDAYCARVTAVGGKIYRPAEDIPGVGRFAVAADPQGAPFILFKGNSAEAPVRAAPGTPGTIGWHELHADDGPRAFAFYAGLFGWTKRDTIDMGPMGVYQTFAAGAEPIGGMMTRMPQTPMAFWLYYFNVDAIDAAQARVTAGGGQILNGPMEVPMGRWILQCLDPQGAPFALLAPKR